MTISQMAVFHAEVAAVIDEACFGAEVFDAEKIRTFLKSPQVFGLMVHENEQPIGYALFQNVMEEGEVLTLGILPEFQGEGYGRQLLQAGLDELKSRQVLDVFLEVRASNQHAIALYHKFGCQKVGERIGYYENADGSKEDALVYCLNL